MLEYAMVVTSAISLVAVVISLVSLHRTSRYQHALIDAQKKQAEAEARADVRVELVKTGRNDHKFFITNVGKAPARHITFEVVPDEGKEDPFVRGDYDRKVPIQELAPGGQVALLASICFETGITFEGRWTWQNPDGTKGERASLLAV